MLPLQSSIQSVEDRKENYKQIFDYHTNINAHLFLFGCGFFRLTHLELYNYVTDTNANTSSDTVYQILTILLFTIIPIILTVLLTYFIFPKFGPNKVYYRWCQSQSMLFVGICRIFLQFTSIWLAGKNNIVQIIIVIIAIAAWLQCLLYMLGMAFAFRRLDHWAFAIVAGILMDSVMRIGSQSYDMLCDPNVTNIIVSIVPTLLWIYFATRIKGTKNWESLRRRDQAIIDGFEETNDKNAIKSFFFGVGGRPHIADIGPFHFATGTELVAKPPFLTVIIVIAMILLHIFYLGNVYMFEYLSNSFNENYFVLMYVFVCVLLRQMLLCVIFFFKNIFLVFGFYFLFILCLF